jgi:cell fate regulator YaaT (PSP1 superfamily)
MSQVIEVSFKGNRREFFVWEGEDVPPVKSAVVVEADRGEDLGYVHAIGDLAARRVAGVAHRPVEGETPKGARRLATPEEVRRDRDLREQDEVARRKAMERVKANGLAMKLSDAEWRWDRRKLTLYFTAEKRVDFRTLVRELASMFRTRIELKQIGVRDEARRLSGIGRCGREYCSASWLPELRPVNLGVAKDQRLSLNPTQISGACGRLMCCLRYEHEFYVQQRKRFPKEGKSIEAGRGEERVLSNDIFRERVTLRNSEGEVRVVPLAELRMDWRGAPAPVLDEDTPPIPYEAISDEVLRLQDTSELPAWRPDLARTRAGLPVLPGPGGPAAGARPRPPARPASDRPPGAGGTVPDRPAAADAGARALSPLPPGVQTPEGSAETAAGEGGTGEEAGTRPRRRRGRRGGRRARGEGGAGDSATGPADQPTDSDPPAGDDG